MAKFKAVVFDWAGTMIDFGSFAPTGVFIKAFSRFGITASVEQARAPMGQPKRDHIRSMMDNPEIAAQWEAEYGHAPKDSDISEVYELFIPMNREELDHGLHNGTRSIRRTIAHQGTEWFQGCRNRVGEAGRTSFDRRPGSRMAGLYKNRVLPQSSLPLKTESGS